LAIGVRIAKINMLALKKNNLSEAYKLIVIAARVLRAKMPAARTENFIFDQRLFRSVLEE
jgi:hypothetical protein